MEYLANSPLPCWDTLPCQKGQVPAAGRRQDAVDPSLAGSADASRSEGRCTVVPCIHSAFCGSPSAPLCRCLCGVLGIQCTRRKIVPGLPIPFRKGIGSDNQITDASEEIPQVQLCTGIVERDLSVQIDPRPVFVFGLHSKSHGVEA